MHFNTCFRPLLSTPIFGTIAAPGADRLLLLTENLSANRFMATRAGPLATINCEPRQAWKGAAAAVDSCAGCGWCGLPPS